MFLKQKKKNNTKITYIYISALDVGSGSGYLTVCMADMVKIDKKK